MRWLETAETEDRFIDAPSLTKVYPVSAAAIRTQVTLLESAGQSTFLFLKGDPA